MEKFILIFIAVTVVFINSMITFWPEYTDSYKQGQIDALSGKVIYELKTQPNGEKTWKRK
jgi:hypothetical protein